MVAAASTAPAFFVPTPESPPSPPWLPPPFPSTTAAHRQHSRQAQLSLLQRPKLLAFGVFFLLPARRHCLVLPSRLHVAAAKLLNRDRPSLFTTHLRRSLHPWSLPTPPPLRSTLSPLCQAFVLLLPSLPLLSSIFSVGCHRYASKPHCPFSSPASSPPSPTPPSALHKPPSRASKTLV